MAAFLPKKLPRYDCLLRAAEQFPDLDPSACEAYLHLLKAGDRAFQMSAGHFAKHGLSGGGFMVLMLLLNRCMDNGSTPSGTPAELAELAGVARATMTGLIDTLEGEGLVERRPNPSDRRMMQVEITARGRRLLQGLLPGHFQRMSALMRPLSPAERKTLVGLLARIVDAAPVAGDSEAPAGHVTPSPSPR